MATISTTVYDVSVHGIDALSSLFFQGSKVQWGNAAAGLPGKTFFEFTTTLAGQLPQPSRNTDWTPSFPGGIVAPNGWNGSDSFDTGQALPLPNPGETTTYTLAKETPWGTVTQEVPSDENNHTYILTFTDPAPGAHDYVLEIVMTTTLP